jgi:hypothetical protein
MNCEICQELVSDFVDGALSREDAAMLNLHLEECLDCADVRDDLETVVGFCREHRGEYDAPPNERALWLRISNTLAATDGVAIPAGAVVARREGFLGGLFSRSWQLSFPQLAAAVAAIVLIVSLVTVVALRRAQSNNSGSTPPIAAQGFDLDKRMWQQQQAISYWNARVATNKARWSPQMRDTFDRNLGVIDEAVNASLKELNKNPHDEVSEEMLNAALSDKIALLKDFSDF